MATSCKEAVVNEMYNRTESEERVSAADHFKVDNQIAAIVECSEISVVSRTFQICRRKENNYNGQNFKGQTGHQPTGNVQGRSDFKYECSTERAGRSRE